MLEFHFLHSFKHRNRRRNGGGAAGANPKARRGSRAAPAGAQWNGALRRSLSCCPARRA
ncbi:hypothetical protein SJA_C1-31890 [Sphingobium indicum UT26S]|uniref:Uncharacterized protein n=1 Tax=Sphingobium indicum (strain DSM 16413 / CCM 7287 / MTCC 6362 / UT26 / NBRC 101211 / UT26S) TaxID=452662 RepID=D4Z5Z1_SPHIU|nr:hypothetical protein SJA_C1-31890 [Sphingobium indicum UT26S]